MAATSEQVTAEAMLVRAEAKTTGVTAEAAAVSNAFQTQIAKPGEFQFLAGEAAPNGDEAKAFGKNQFSHINPDGTTQQSLDQADRQVIHDNYADIHAAINKGDAASMAVLLGGAHDITPVIESMINQNPVFAAEYKSLNAAGKKKFMESMIKNPNTKKVLNEKLKTAYSMGRMIDTEANGLMSQNTLLEAKQQELEKKKTDQEKVLKELNEEHREFDTYMDTTGPKEGEFVTKLRTFNEAVESQTLNVENLKTQLANIEQRITNAYNNKGALLINGDAETTTTVMTKGGPQSITSGGKGSMELKDKAGMFQDDIKNTLTVERDKVLQALEKAQRELSENKTARDSIESRRASLKQRIAETNSSISKIEEDMGKNKDSLDQNSIKMQEAIRKRDALEQQWLGEVRSALPEAIAASMNSYREEIIEMQEKVDKEGKEQAQGAREQAVQNAVYDFLRDPAQAGGVDWANLDPTMDTFRNQGIDQVLTANIFAGNTADLEAYKKENPDGYNNLKQKMQDKLIRLRLSQTETKRSLFFKDRQVPKALSEAERNDIADRLGSDYFKNKVSGDEQLKASLRQAGINPDGDMAEQMKQRPPANVFAILMLLLGVGLSQMSK